MKKIAMLFVTLLISSKSFAWAVSSTVENKNICVGDREIKGCLLLTPLTTFFPLTMLILDSGAELDLNSEEANARLQLEAQGLAEKQLINMISADSGLSANEVIREISRMQSEGQEVTVASVVASLRK